MSFGAIVKKIFGPQVDAQTKLLQIYLFKFKTMNYRPKIEKIDGIRLLINNGKV